MKEKNSKKNFLRLNDVTDVIHGSIWGVWLVWQIEYFRIYSTFSFEI